MTESEAPPIERNPPWPGPLPETPSSREQQLETALREARQVIADAKEELRLIHMKDTDAIYHPGLRVLMSISLQNIDTLLAGKGEFWDTPEPQPSEKE